MLNHFSQQTMNLEKMRNQYNRILAQTKSPIPQSIQQLGAELARIETYIPKLEAMQKAIDFASGIIQSIETKHPDLDLAPQTPILVRGKGGNLYRSNPRKNICPPYWSKEKFDEIQVMYNLALIDKIHFTNKRNQYQLWIDTAYENYHSRLSEIRIGLPLANPLAM